LGINDLNDLDILGFEIVKNKTINITDIEKEIKTFYKNNIIYP